MTARAVRFHERSYAVSLAVRSEKLPEKTHVLCFDFAMVSSTYSRLLAYENRLAFWRARLERARKSPFAVASIVPARFVAHYERQIAQIIAREELRLPPV